MACTIDHLRAGAHVTVIREFTDADGVPHRPGDRLLLTALHVDLRARTIRIECRKDGAAHSIRLALDAASGPRNGSMRTYFEVEDAPDGTGATAVVSVVARDAVGSVKPAGTRVPCGCDESLHLPVLLEAAEVGAYGCIGCGTVACARSVGDDGRFTGDSWSAWLPVPVPVEVTTWLAGWPRALTSRSAPLRWPMESALVRTRVQYVPSHLRSHDMPALRRELDREAPPLSGRAAARRLRSFALPAHPPPETLPRDLDSFRLAWEATRGSPDTPIPRLMGWILRGGPACDLAVDLVWCRPDARERMTGSLRSPDPAIQLVGHRLALEAPPGDPEVIETATDILARLPMTPSSEVPGRIEGCLRAERLLVLLLDIRAISPGVREVVAGFRHRVARHDPWLARCAAQAMAELGRTGPDDVRAQPAIWGILP